MQRLKFIVAYEGTSYSGWQIQEKKDAPPTIQGELEKAFKKVSGTNIRVYGAGRTDGGVHAFGQCAHCDLPKAVMDRVKDWRHTLNALLPPDIRIMAAEECDGDFHARKSSLGKTYVYSFWLDREFVPPAQRRYVWPCGPLDICAMSELGHLLKGVHDFASFQNSGTQVRDTRRNIYSLEFHFEEAWPYTSGLLIRMSIGGNGFLKQMVRNIAGLAAMLGKGRMDIKEVEGILAAADRRAMPAITAPASGLALLCVEYAACDAFHVQSERQKILACPFSGINKNGSF